MNRRRAGLSVALIGVALVVGLALRPDDAKQGPATRQEPAPADVAAPFVSSTPSEAPPEPPLPRSLRGTEEDGALVVDSAGRFVPTPDAIDLFDYYLAAAGEEPWAVTASRIRAAIARRLSGAAAQDAERLLDQYLAYRSEASALVTGRDVGQDFARRLQLLRELRREIFGASTARVLFGEEETRWFADLERRRILTDASRSPEDAAAALAAIEASEPAEVTASRASSRAHAALRADEARLRA
ncbi:MAG: lipase secretion chaperone, partial [Myxococcota bacterium]